MSDANPNDPAIEIVRARIGQLETEIALHTHRAATATAIRDDMLELVAGMIRKLRPRKPRVVAEGVPFEKTVGLDTPGAIPDAPRATVFATPANDEADTAAVA